MCTLEFCRMTVAGWTKRPRFLPRRQLGAVGSLKLHQLRLPVRLIWGTGSCESPAHQTLLGSATSGAAQMLLAILFPSERLCPEACPSHCPRTYIFEIWSGSTILICSNWKLLCHTCPIDFHCIIGWISTALSTDGEMCKMWTHWSQY